MKTWHLAVVFVLCLTITVVALRSNYTTMVELREVVYQADREGGDVESALQDLRRFVGSHMNTKLSGGPEAVYPPIQLKGTYDRLQAAELQRVQVANTQLYTDAQNYCENLYPDSFVGGPRVPCIEDYVKSRGVEVKSISDSLYKFDFASPSWSPDVAGWSLVVSVAALLAMLMRFGLGRWLD